MLDWLCWLIDFVVWLTMLLAWLWFLTRSVGWFCVNGVAWLFVIALCVWWPCLITLCDDPVYWPCSPCVTALYMMTLCCDPVWWHCMMDLCDGPAWWPCVMVLNCASLLACVCVTLMSLSVSACLGCFAAHSLISNSLCFCLYPLSSVFAPTLLLPALWPLHASCKIFTWIPGSSFSCGSHFHEKNEIWPISNEKIFQAA